MCISKGNFDSFFFSELRPFWTLKFDQIYRYYSKQFVSTTPLKPLKRISWSFVVMKDIMCRYAFLQETLFWSFLRSNLYLLWMMAKQICATQMKLVFCPIARDGITAWNCHSLYTTFSSNVGAWDYVSLLTLSFIIH